MKVKVAQSCLNLSMEFSRHEYWSGLPFPSPDLPNPGIEPMSPALQADSSLTELQGKPNCPPGKRLNQSREKRGPQDVDRAMSLAQGE